MFCPSLCVHGTFANDETRNSDVPAETRKTMTVSHKLSNDFPAGIMAAAEIDTFLESLFPQAHTGGKVMQIEDAGNGGARIRLVAHDKNLRPGNTLSGPSMFQVADFGMYVAILATLGKGAVQAVTTNLNITFLSRPVFADLIADVRLIKVGRRLVVGEVEMVSVKSGDMVAHAVATYALPPDKL